MRILVVEDEPKVAAFIKQGLEESGHVVVSAPDGLAGKRLAKDDTLDLILLDVMLPRLDGIGACKAIRAGGSKVPILMLTALGTTADKVAGLDAGADDYLVKPFEFQELLARVRSLTRRGNTNSVSLDDKLSYAGLDLDTVKKEVLRNGQRIQLTVKEFELLEFFMRNPQRVLSRSFLSEQVWKIDFNTGTNVVEAYIKLLRKKMDRDFEPKLIHTRFGQGYILTNKP